MRFCQPHWDELRLQVRVQGLSALVPETSQDAVDALNDAREYGPSIDNFDPLMGAFLTVVRQLLGVFPQLAYLKDGECPVCHANEWHRSLCDNPLCGFTYDDWLTYAVRDQAAEWKALGV